MIDEQFADLCFRLTHGGAVTSLELATAGADVVHAFEEIAARVPANDQVGLRALAQASLLLSSLMMSWVYIARQAGVARAVPEGPGS